MIPNSQSSESGIEYDPIYSDAVHPSNFVHNTLFTANNLTLVGITLPWAIALKLVRYTMFDPSDTCVMLRLVIRFGTKEFHGPGRDARHQNPDAQGAYVHHSWFIFTTFCFGDENIQAPRH